ncbi:hypothetical protein DCAR_0103668 [Daucus carota subsp. sativus]|uniref:Uncharacterized protein n=1 Tax=Daucus carota subsp. sativus TaxID=79200 RepID=A0A166I6L2_DAUCS|nr:PREDICTED: protein MIZU-KUSSEI 1 [Daucus carota subsp. sativus]WOG84484.1 hypothetical protein DCAR_0103668 [Daucus carota subsp. sativus]
MYYSSYPSFGATKVVSTGITTVDCEKQVRSWRLFRSLLKLLIPTCNNTFTEHHPQVHQKNCMQYHDYYPSNPIISNPTSTTITGTIFGQRKGKVNFCIQTNPKSSTTPILLLDLAIPTTILAREMRGGLRIVLESTSNLRSSLDSNNSLLSMPVWKMFCNGKKVGFAEKRSPSKADKEILERMESVAVGAGVLSGKDLDRDDETMYLRGNFQWVRGSLDSDTFHFIDPDGNVGQGLSIFFLRSRN